MKTTMIGFGVTQIHLDEIAKYIENYLIQYKVPYELIEDRHISIVQIKEKVKKDEMVRLVNSIDPIISLRPKKISVLYGREFDFITLELHTSDEYKELYCKIKDSYDIIQFGDDIRPHISLFKIPSGIASEDFMCDVMEDVPFPKKIKTGAVELWGGKFEIEYIKK